MKESAYLVIWFGRGARRDDAEAHGSLERGPAAALGDGHASHHERLVVRLQHEAQLRRDEHPRLHHGDRLINWRCAPHLAKQYNQYEKFDQIREIYNQVK